MPPSCISNVLADLRVADHVLDLKGFDADHLVIVNQSAGHFMEVVHPAIGDLGVNTRHFAFGLGPSFPFPFKLTRRFGLGNLIADVDGFGDG
jgi:hypothetical protein